MSIEEMIAEFFEEQLKRMRKRVFEVKPQVYCDKLEEFLKEEVKQGVFVEVTYGSFNSFKNEVRAKIFDTNNNFEFIGDVNIVFDNLMSNLYLFKEEKEEKEELNDDDLEEVKEPAEPIKEQKTTARVIEVNKMCVISNTERYPDRNLIVAIDVMALDDSKDGFVNLTVGVDDYQSCCEDYGISVNTDFTNPIEIYVKQIILVNKGLDECGTVEEEIQVFVVCEGMTYEATAYNHHNGYYGHWVGYVLNDGELEIDYSEI